MKLDEVETADNLRYTYVWKLSNVVLFPSRYKIVGKWLCDYCVCVIN